MMLVVVVEALLHYMTDSKAVHGIFMSQQNVYGMWCHVFI